MQNKNTIKQILFLVFSLVVGEGILGFGIFWPILLTMKDRAFIFWVAFLSGLYLSVLYQQKIGLMSLFLVSVLSFASMFMGSGRGLGKWIVLLSVLLSWMFDSLFGLGFGWIEAIVVIIVSMVVVSFFETNETIRLNL